MTEFQLTLSAGAADYIDQQLATGQFASASEVVSRTLEQALEHQARQRLRALLCEGLESGPATQVTPELLAQRRVELIARLPSGVSE
jgi:antitoxin ParD1/3/4